MFHLRKKITQKIEFFIEIVQEIISTPLSESDSTESIDDKRNCDQATNDMSSADKMQQLQAPQPHQHQPINQNASESTGTDNAQTAEEDEDEDRKTNHLYPYSSISTTHNHYGNDDDDDCNSSEDTKTSCPSECVSLKTEQHNGQQQQVKLNMVFDVSFIFSIN